MADETIFYDLAQETIYRLLEREPVLATEMGEHRWDGSFGDSTLEALEAHNAEIHEQLGVFESIDTPQFTKDAKADHAVMIFLLRDLIRDHEVFRKHRIFP